MAPIDWNIVKYLNPQVSVSDKMDQQSQLSMEQAYKQIQMKKMQDELARQDAIAQEMQAATSGSQASDPYQQILDMSSAYTKARMRQGLDANSGQILQALDPEARKWKALQMENVLSQIRNRDEEKPTTDKKVIRMVKANPDGTFDEQLADSNTTYNKLMSADYTPEDNLSGRAKLKYDRWKSTTSATGAGKMQTQGNPNRIPVKIIRTIP